NLAAFTLCSEVTISRHHKGDMFTAEGATCSKDVCVGSSSGTAGMAEGTDCTCQCLPHLPVFREDLHICIDDIHGHLGDFRHEYLTRQHPVS
ncbi:hypothetical protein L9F63_019743, partial [Diploptera punctata]